MAETVAEKAGRDAGGSPAPPREPAADPREPHAIVRFAEWFWSLPVLLLAEIGLVARLLFETILWGVRPPYRGRTILSAMAFVGVDSIFLVTLTGFFVGAVFGLQIIDGFSLFSAENYVGTVV